MNRIIKRLAVPLSAAAVLGTAGFAYMASGTFTGQPGSSEAVVSVTGYNVSQISTTACSFDPTKTCQEHFKVTPTSNDVSAAATSVQVRPLSGTSGSPVGEWVTCKIDHVNAGSATDTAECLLNDLNGQRGITTTSYNALDVVATH